MILKSMGVEVNKSDMDNNAAEVDEEETGKFTFMMFCQVAAKFMIEDDEEEMKEILREIDSSLTEDDLDNIIEEVDEDGSGTMDFDEFQEMMMG